MKISQYIGFEKITQNELNIFLLFVVGAALLLAFFAYFQEIRKKKEGLRGKKSKDKKKWKLSTDKNDNMTLRHKGGEVLKIRKDGKIANNTIKRLQEKFKNLKNVAIAQKRRIQ